MYKVKIGDEYLYHPWDSTRQIADPKLDTELNKNGSFTFSVYSDNPFYDSFKKLKTIIRIIDFDTQGNEKEIFCSRVLDEEIDFEGEKTITCEGNMAYLLDSVQRPYKGEYTPSELFRLYIGKHNEQVEPEKQFRIGNVTVAGEKAKYDESDYKDTRTAIDDKLLNVYGGYIRTREEKGEYYIDYLKEYDDETGQAVTFGKNILDITKYIKADDIKTCIIPLGATNSAIGRPVTISSVNNNVDYICDLEAVKAFGKIFGTVSYSDVESPSRLLERAKEDIKELVNLSITIELTAIDLKDLGYDVKNINVGDKIPVRSKPHGINAYMQVSKVSKNLKDVSDCKVTLGSTIKTLIETQNTYNSGIKSVEAVASGAAARATTAEKNAAEAIKAAGEITFNTIYPIGSIYMSINDTNPEKLFGGTWAAWGTGRVPVGVDTSDSDFSTVEKTGGEKTHKLSTDELASHKHSTTVNITEKQLIGTVHNFAGQSASWGPGNTVSGICSASGDDTAFYPSGTSKTTKYKDGFKIDATHSHAASATMENAGGGNAHNNMQPYITCYMWKRIE